MKSHSARKQNGQKSQRKENIQESKYWNSISVLFPVKPFFGFNFLFFFLGFLLFSFACGRRG